MIEQRLKNESLNLMSKNGQFMTMYVPVHVKGCDLVGICIYLTEFYTLNLISLNLDIAVCYTTIILIRHPTHHKLIHPTNEFHPIRLPS